MTSEREADAETIPDEVPAKLLHGKLCLTGPALADALGVSRQALGNWVRDGCPKETRGWYCLHDVLAWRGVIGGKSGQGEPSTQQQKLQFDADVRQQQAENLRLKNAVAKRELIPKSEIIEVLTPYFAELKRSLLAYSRDLVTLIAPQVDAATARRIGRETDELARAFLRKIAAGVEYVAPARPRKRRREEGKTGIGKT